jgi:S-adenosylmethionine/arginine decarboxylase-like enzyme
MHIYIHGYISISMGTTIFAEVEVYECGFVYIDGSAKYVVSNMFVIYW